jgi:glucose/arabinose dehydrogenase
MGKILRIDVDRMDGDRAYGIPADNPFVDTEGVLPEIYAYGFRNPWRITFDRQTGTLWMGDVGQDFWEEVNIVTKGGNYGWSNWEGTFPFSDHVEGSPSEPIGPVWQYDHLAGKSITGGYVYRGPGVPELAGVYLYNDFVSGKLWGLKYDEQSQKVEWNKSIPANALTVLAFGEAEDGEIYLSIPTGNGQGLFKFASAD